MDKAYEQTGDYMPKADAPFRDWLWTFASLIQADPQKYGFDSSDATIIMNHYNSYNAAYQLVQSNATRTPSAIAQKDAIKAAARASCRVYAMLCKSNQGVTNQDKLDLGLHINDTPSPVPVPSTAPMLMIQSAFSGEHVIRYADEMTPASRRKPEGVKFIEIACNIAPGPDPVVANATIIELTGRQPITIAQSQANAGATASYFGRWVNTKGEKGPWGLPVAMIIAFGGPIDQQMPTGGTSLPGDQELKIAA